YPQMCFGASLEVQKQSEAAQRMATLLQSVLPFLSQDQQVSTMLALEKASQISMPELMQLAQQQQAQQMLGMAAGPMGAMGQMGLPMGLAPPNMHPMSPAMRPAQSPAVARPAQPSVKREPIPVKEEADEDIDVTNMDDNAGRDSRLSGISSSGTVTPAPTIERIAVPNGKLSFTLRMDATGSMIPIPELDNLAHDSAVPTGLTPIQELLHGDVVCSVAISKDVK
ncbi:hypothetical protein PENTCL1PPCAC_21173, partial [Pristionchus entomophagus]